MLGEKNMESKQVNSLSVGKDGYVYADGIKIGRHIPERGTIAIMDKDQRRCLQKGREIVEIKIAEFIKLDGNK